MSFNVPTRYLRQVKHKSLKKQSEWAHEHVRNQRDLKEDEFQYLEIDLLDTEALTELRAIAQTEEDQKTIRAIDAILDGRKGKFDLPVPNFRAALGTIRAFLRYEVIDGWVYVEKKDGWVYPELVTDVTYHPSGRYDQEYVSIHTTYKGIEREDGSDILTTCHATYKISPGEITRKRVGDALAKQGIKHESKFLKKAHCDSMARHEEITKDGFAGQFRFNGRRLTHTNRLDDSVYEQRKVIHDMPPREAGQISSSVESDYAPGKVGFIPEHLVVRVFDLEEHEEYWVAADALSPYKYDKTLGDKIILPESHRNLLEILTTNLNDFIDDFVEGKHAGNVILCKGPAGVGKSLTAEVFAELINKPLYRVRAGELGTTAAEITANLKVVLDRGLRWGCVMLLDEADVFVARRNDDIERNAVVAEFLRVLEYFSGLLFMTTNRPDDIDDAIISRCIAVINYEAPGFEDLKLVWEVMSNQFKAGLDSAMIATLAKAFPQITPRDVKMLLRLALKTGKKRKAPLDLKLFKNCALFRAIKIEGK
jgi:hypothetical protein